MLIIDFKYSLIHFVSPSPKHVMYDNYPNMTNNGQLLNK